MTVSTVGEEVKAFVPSALPPEPDIDWTPALRGKFDAALLTLGRLDSVSILGLLAAIAGCFLVCGTPGVRIKCINNTGSDLVNLKIAFSGGLWEHERMADGETARTRIRVSGESILRVTHQVAGTTHAHCIGVYLERGYCGSLRIVFLPSNDLFVTGHIHAFPIERLLDLVCGRMGTSAVYQSQVSENP